MIITICAIVLCVIAAVSSYAMGLREGHAQAYQDMNEQYELYNKIGIQHVKTSDAAEYTKELREIWRGNRK